MAAPKTKIKDIKTHRNQIFNLLPIVVIVALASVSTSPSASSAFAAASSQALFSVNIYLYNSIRPYMYVYIVFLGFIVRLELRFRLLQLGFFHIFYVFQFVCLSEFLLLLLLFVHMQSVL